MRMIGYQGGMQTGRHSIDLAIAVSGGVKTLACYRDILGLAAARWSS